MAAQAAIVGLGFSALSREPVGTARELAVDAVLAAVADAGMKPADVDGLLITGSPSAPVGALPLRLQRDLSLGPLRLLAKIDGEGTSVLQALQHASLALQAGMVHNVVCVFSDARVQGSGSAAGYAKAMELTGIPDWEAQCGLFGAVGAYALAASRHLARFGLTEDDLAAYAISCRQWAALNPQAFLREPLTLEQHRASRHVAQPLRVLDCAYAVNGAAAVVMTAAQAAADHAQPPVYVHGFGQGHAGDGSSAGARGAVDGALRMAGISMRDVAMAQIYDPFSSAGLELIEAYGLCDAGDSGRFVRSGATAPGGAMPVNTGGGHLSGFYLQGMTPVAEAVVQARGQGGARQARRGPVLVGGMGGCLDYHVVAVFSEHKALA